MVQVLLILPRCFSEILFSLSVSNFATLHFSVITSSLFNISLGRCCQSFQDFLKPQSHNYSFFIFLFVDIFHNLFLIVFILLNFFLKIRTAFIGSYLHRIYFFISDITRLSDDLSLWNLDASSLHVLAVFVDLLYISSHASVIFFISHGTRFL